MAQLEKGERVTYVPAPTAFQEHLNQNLMTIRGLLASQTSNQNEAHPHSYDEAKKLVLRIFLLSHILILYNAIINPLYVEV